MRCRGRVRRGAPGRGRQASAVDLERERCGPRNSGHEYVYTEKLGGYTGSEGLTDQEIDRGAEGGGSPHIGAEVVIRDDTVVEMRLIEDRRGDCVSCELEHQSHEAKAKQWPKFRHDKQLREAGDFSP